MLTPLRVMLGIEPPGELGQGLCHLLARGVSRLSVVARCIRRLRLLLELLQIPRKLLQLPGLLRRRTERFLERVHLFLHGLGRGARAVAGLPGGLLEFFHRWRLTQLRFLPRDLLGDIGQISQGLSFGQGLLG